MYAVTSNGVSENLEDYLNIDDMLEGSVSTYPNIEEFCISGENDLCPSHRLNIRVHINGLLVKNKNYTRGCNGGTQHFHFKFDAEEGDLVIIEATPVLNYGSNCICKRLGTADIAVCHD